MLGCSNGAFAVLPGPWHFQPLSNNSVSGSDSRFLILPFNGIHLWHKVRVLFGSWQFYLLERPTTWDLFLTLLHRRRLTQVLEAWRNFHSGFQKKQKQGKVLRENINYVLSKIHKQFLTPSQFPLCNICVKSLSTQSDDRENLGRVSFWHIAGEKLLWKSAWCTLAD